ncbi:hypothetical protein Peur_057657 [Populus x canadensis]
MKSVISWRTEHQVYELPDNHELLVWVSYSSLSLLCDVIKLCRLTKTRFLTDLSEQLDKREKDDSVPFLLSVWQAGRSDPEFTYSAIIYANSIHIQLPWIKTVARQSFSFVRPTKDIDLWMPYALENFI